MPRSFVSMSMERARMMRTTSVLAALATMVGTALTTGTGSAGAVTSATANGTAGTVAAATPATLARAAFDRMSEAQRIGQLFMVGTPATGLSAAAAKAVSTYHVGNLILTGRTTTGTAPVRYVAAQADRLTTTAATAGVPLYVSADQEGGNVQVLQGPGYSTMPTAQTQGTWADSTLTADARTWGLQMARSGVDMNLAPVMDTVPASLGTKNIPIGYYHREFGYTPTVVATKGSDFTRGMHSAGMTVTAKHFPGLGHVTANTDTTAGVKDTVTTRTSADIAPFRSAVSAGARAVMVSLAIYTKIDATLPAAMSAPVITGMLRGDLGFTGIVMSDDMGNAKQVAAWTPDSRAVDFIDAGGDIVLTVNPALIPQMTAAVTRWIARLPEFKAKVEAAAYRVLLQKATDGLLATRLTTDGGLGSLTLSATQRWLGVPVTGTFNATTIRALQARVGTAVDGGWGPSSMAATQSYLGISRDGAKTWNARTVNALQAYLNTQL